MVDFALSIIILITKSCGRETSDFWPIVRKHRLELELNRDWMYHGGTNSNEEKGRGGRVLD